MSFPAFLISSFKVWSRSKTLLPLFPPVHFPTPSHCRRELQLHRIRTIRTMAAVIAATVATPQMIRGGEDHQAAVEIEVAGPKLWPGNPTFLGAMKFHDALAADAGFVAQFRRHARQQLLGDRNCGAPAWAFVGRSRAELTLIGSPAQWTLCRIGAGIIRGHKANCRRTKNRCRARHWPRRFYFR